jgi:hypothetical protein
MQFIDRQSVGMELQPASKSVLHSGDHGYGGWRGFCNWRQKDSLAQLGGDLFFSFASLLVTRSGAFYNPSNTAFGAVVSFTDASVLNRQTERLQLPRASA